jgi:hypothetical protein
MDQISEPNILIFLPQSATAWVAGVLDKGGYRSAGVSTILELHEALLTDRFNLVVTTRPDIDLVRRIKALPVVNLEIFFHAEGHGQTPKAKQFDTQAFQRRIKALTESRHIERRSTNEQGPSSMQRQGWLAYLKRLLSVSLRKPASF